MANVIKLYCEYASEGSKQELFYNSPLFGGLGDIKDFVKKMTDYYSKVDKFDMYRPNGNTPYEYGATDYTGHTLYAIVGIDRRNLNQEHRAASHKESGDFPTYYAISVDSKTNELFFMAYSDVCSPNWNREYRVIKATPLEDIGTPLVDSYKKISKIDKSVLQFIRDNAEENDDDFYKCDDGIWSITIQADLTGARVTLKGSSKEDIFRNIADNYQGQRNMRCPSTSNYDLVSVKGKAEFDEWIKTAKGLKSSFDKFYRGGFVD